MKKTLLTIFAAVATVATVSAQCTPDPQYANASGNFFPDSASFIDNDFAMSGVDYEATIDIKTITDTLVTAGGFTVTAYIDAFKIHEVSGMPAGFSYSGGGATYEAVDPNTNFNDPSTETWWNAYGAVNDHTSLSIVQGCLQMTAAAVDVAAAAPATGFTDYPIQVLVDARVVATNPDVNGLVLDNGTWLSETTLSDVLPVDGYILRVYAASGVVDVLNTNTFEVAQSYPNPASDMATISFTTPNSTKVEFNVYNMLGGLVYSETVASQKGMNNIELETASMTSGIYVYTVSNGVKTYTKRMSVK